jgi:hypothetical protein
MSSMYKDYVITNITLIIIVIVLYGILQMYAILFYFGPCIK